MTVCARNTDRIEKSKRRTAMMNGHGKSDSLMVPARPPNKADRQAAEVVEGKGLAEGKTLERNRFRTQSRQILSSALERIRHAWVKEGSELHHSRSSVSVCVKT